MRSIVAELDQVAAKPHVDARRTCLAEQIGQVRPEFGRAAGDVDESHSERSASESERSMVEPDISSAASGEQR